MVQSKKERRGFGGGIVLRLHTSCALRMIGLGLSKLYTYPFVLSSIEGRILSIEERIKD